jgi:hypothetical protein
MASYLYVGVAPDELHERVMGDIWQGWTDQEPALRPFDSLRDPTWLDSPDRDQGLGALIRLAAKDGGDDELAAIAVCHRMRPAVLRAIREFGLDDDAEAVVVGALWESIRAFPWHKRSRAYASHLSHDTRLRVLRFQTTRRHPHDRFRCVFVGSDDLLDWAGRTIGVGSTDIECTDSPAELFDLFEWARGSGVLRDGDIALLRDLVAASYAVTDQDTPWTARGASSQAALRWLAERTGTSARTLRRKRDHAIQRLRLAAPQYLSDVA